MEACRKLVDLRKLLAERFPQVPIQSGTHFLPTGFPLIDSATGGGLPRGAITEISSPEPSAGSASVIAALIQAAADSGHCVALVDGSDSFDPAPLRPASLAHLLWVRCDGATVAFKAADLLLRDGNFPLVLLDLVLNTANEFRKIPATSWYRLQRLVEPTATAFVVLARRSRVASAHLKLSLQNRWTLDNFDTPEARSFLKLEVDRKVAIRRSPILTFRPAPPAKEMLCASTHPPSRPRKTLPPPLTLLGSKSPRTNVEHWKTSARDPAAAGLNVGKICSLPQFISRTSNCRWRCVRPFSATAIARQGPLPKIVPPPWSVTEKNPSSCN